MTVPIMAWVQMVSAEARMVARDTAGLVVPLGVPVLILVMYGLGEGAHSPIGPAGLTAFEYTAVPLALVIVVATVGCVNAPSFLANYRKNGVLRRLAVTPARPTMVLGAQVIVSVAQTVLGIVLALAVAHVAFDLGVPGNVTTTAVAIGLTIAAMYSLGMLVAAVAPSANAAVAIGLLMFFATGAVGGLFGPVEQLPSPLDDLGSVTPFGAAVAALRAGWAGDTLPADSVVALTGAALVTGVLAIASFRWD